MSPSLPFLRAHSRKPIRSSGCLPEHKEGVAIPGVTERAWIRVVTNDSLVATGSCSYHRASELPRYVRLSKASERRRRRELGSWASNPAAHQPRGALARSRWQPPRARLRLPTSLFSEPRRRRRGARASVSPSSCLVVSAPSSRASFLGGSSDASYAEFAALTASSSESQIAMASSRRVIWKMFL